MFVSFSSLRNPIVNKLNYFNFPHKFHSLLAQLYKVVSNLFVLYVRSRGLLTPNKTRSGVGVLRHRTIVRIPGRGEGKKRTLLKCAPPMFFVDIILFFISCFPRPSILNKTGATCPLVSVAVCCTQWDYFELHLWDKNQI